MISSEKNLPVPIGAVMIASVLLPGFQLILGYLAFDITFVPLHPVFRLL